MLKQIQTEKENKLMKNLNINSDKNNKSWKNKVCLGSKILRNKSKAENNFGKNINYKYKNENSKENKRSKLNQEFVKKESNYLENVINTYSRHNLC